MEGQSLRIEYEEVPNVLLLGNGINRLYKFASWDTLIQSIRTKELSQEQKDALEKMPYPLRPIVLTEDHLGSKMKEIAPELTALRAPAEEEQMLRELIELPFNAILTTNYTYELEKAIHPDFKCAVGRMCKMRHMTYACGHKNEVKQLYTYFEGVRDGQSVWHIHGEAAKPQTMVLGHYFYGKLLSLMQSYISILQRRYHGNLSRKQGMDCHSWIDLFMLGNVYIVGQGMDLSELDLWWLINCKRRHFPSTNITLYKSHIKPEQKLLCDTYHVKVISKKREDTGYTEYYHDIIDQLRREL